MGERGGMESLCVTTARTRQEGRVNKYEAVRISRDKVVTGWTARTLAPMRSIEFAVSSVRSIEQGTRERHERRVTSGTFSFRAYVPYRSVVPHLSLARPECPLACTGLLRPPRLPSRGEPSCRPRLRQAAFRPTTQRPIFYLLQIDHHRLDVIRANAFPIHQFGDQALSHERVHSFSAFFRPHSVWQLHAVKHTHEIPYLRCEW